MGTSYDGALYRKYRNDCEIFLETGSYIGDGIQGALNAGFDSVISIELAQCQYDYCAERFKNNNKINLILGDSRKLLPETLNNYKNKKIFFWIDAHCSGGNTQGDNINKALIQELKILLPYCIDNNITGILAMDDITPKLENMLKKYLKKYPVNFLAKELCINPYNDYIETNRSIIIAELNAK